MIKAENPQQKSREIWYEVSNILTSNSQKILQKKIGKFSEKYI